MAASVLFACGLNEQKLPPLVHISEESDIDGTFLISSILGQRLRISNAGTLLVCLQHNYQHYFNAGMRLGYNANIFLGKTFNVIDPLTELNRDFTTSKWFTDERQLTAVLMESIKTELATNYANRNGITILIDNLAILLNLGATAEELLFFVQELAALPQKFENLTVITKLSNCNDYAAIDSGIVRYAELRIRVNKLKSGTFREVDGKLMIERKPESDGFIIDQAAKEVLYKVNDRNVKIFSLGEVGMKA